MRCRICVSQSWQLSLVQEYGESFSGGQRRNASRAMSSGKLSLLGL
jgi:hypothetical protein